MAVTSAENIALSAPASQDEVMGEAAPLEVAGSSSTPEQADTFAASQQAATSAVPNQAASVAEPEQAGLAAPKKAASSAKLEQAIVAAAPDQDRSAPPDQDGAGNAAALEVREAASEEEGSRDWAAALVGSQYETVLLAMLEGLRQDTCQAFIQSNKHSLPVEVAQDYDMSVVFGITK